MKNKTLLTVILVTAFIALSFHYLNKKNFPEMSSSRDIRLKFITYNGYGNNLYIDNILTGIQPNNDVSVTSYLNIPYDTSYSTLQSGTDTIAPLVMINNLGRNPSDTVFAYLEINPGGYFDRDTVLPIGTGQGVTATFQNFVYKIGTGYYFKAYTTSSLDSNRTNDTLFQYSITLPGFQREVLYEEFTCNSSPSCANNNAYLNSFVNRNFENVCAIKYHLEFPSYLDSFYLQNPVQANSRKRYYFATSVPTTIVDGFDYVSIPYGDSLNLYQPFTNAISKGTPADIVVSDSLVSKDSIRTTILVNFVSGVRPGNYRLRINAVERFIYSTTSGTNGETNFFDVFRKCYPDTSGFQIQPTPGVQEYSLTYYIEPYWADSMIYTVAFIQNDNNRRILNCGKGRDSLFNPQINNSGNTNQVNSFKSDVFEWHYDINGSFVKYSFADSIQTSLNIELFEGYYPPIGWTVYNQDGFITFEQYAGVNGPTFAGTNSVYMDFFDYNIPGQRDSMDSKIYTRLLSSDTLRFDYSYAQYNSTNIDCLTVKLSTDGGISYPTEVFRKWGVNLATAPQTTSFFIPSNTTQWRTYSFPLSSVVSVENDFENVPAKFSLQQNFPNPFNPVTVIGYDLTISDDVKLIVYDITGRKIKTLVNKRQTAGRYEIKFNGENLASGIYFYQLTTGGFTDVKRMVLIK